MRMWPCLCRRGKLKQEASTLLSTFRTALHSCRELSQRTPGNADSASLSAEHTVCMCADLDRAYYALLEHHLSCGYDTPPVPPPHVYFPALAQAHPGVAEGLLTLFKLQAHRRCSHMSSSGHPCRVDKVAMEYTYCLHPRLAPLAKSAPVQKAVLGKDVMAGTEYLQLVAALSSLTSSM